MLPIIVRAENNESPEQLLKQFRKAVTKAQILSAIKRKRWYISKSEMRRLKKKKAIRKLRRKLRKRMMMQKKK